MKGRSSRTYRLNLSERGLALYLSSHLRLCTLARDLLPYGATLQAAIDLLAQRETEELAADLLDDGLADLIGKGEHFVGGPSYLGRSARAIKERVSQSGLVHAPQIGRIYIAGLNCLSACENREIGGLLARLSTARNG